MTDLGDMIKALEPQVRTVAGQRRVIAFGDAFHSPLQITHPLWQNTFDFDHQQSTSLRRGLI